jgi:transposase-like protein
LMDKLNTMNFSSIVELLDFFKDESKCVSYYERMRWEGKPTCPHCGSTKPYKTNRGYKCSNSECHKKFTVKIGTIFENSKIPFRIWFGAIYLATSHKKGISSVQLAIDLNITQKTAWFMLHRIREMLEEDSPKLLSNTVEVDETYIGGREGNKHARRRLKEGEASKKAIVVGAMERGGKVIVKHVNGNSEEKLMPFIESNVSANANVVSDEFGAYRNLSRKYVHSTINHSMKVYVDGDVHTNTIENFWSVLKRGLNGIYHSVSKKHLKRYLNEFPRRFNERDIPEKYRFERFLAGSERRLSYKSLIA